MTDGNLPHQARNLSGQTFGMLRALRPGKTDGRKRSWVFACECGQLCEKVGTEVKKALRRGGLPNCGCKTKSLISEGNRGHGMSRHPAYAVWRSMNDRCRLKSHQAWRNYGGRGIFVCDTWQQGFELFWADMGSSYRPGLSLDRIDNSRGYSKQNCRWTDRHTQGNNRRTNRRISTPKGKMTVAQASREFGVGVTTLLYRMSMRWPTSRLLIPPHPTNRGFSTS